MIAAKGISVKCGHRMNATETAGLPDAAASARSRIRATIRRFGLLRECKSHYSAPTKTGQAVYQRPGDRLAAGGRRRPEFQLSLSPITIAPFVKGALATVLIFLRAHRRLPPG